MDNTDVSMLLQSLINTNIHDFTHGLQGKKVSSLDLVKAYHQIPVEDADIPKTVVITAADLFQCLFMPFGLSSATQIFLRFIDQMLRALDFVFAHLDYLLIAFANEEQN